MDFSRIRFQARSKIWSSLNIFGGWNGINYPIFRAKKIEASPLQGYTNIEPASQIVVEYPQNGGFLGGCMSTEETI